LLFVNHNTCYIVIGDDFRKKTFILRIVSILALCQVLLLNEYICIVVSYHLYCSRLC